MAEVNNLLRAVCIAAAFIIGMPSLGIVANAQELDRAYASLSESNDLTKADHARFARFWSLIDDKVVGSLNSGLSVARVQELLRTLPGFVDPKSAKGNWIGGAIFYSERERDLPTYMLGAPGKDTSLLLGLYNHGSFGPGRLSIYRRDGQTWVRTSKVDGEGPLEVYPLSASDSSLAVATIDVFNAADRSEGTLIVWQEREGKLVRALPALKELVDFRASLSNGLLRIEYDRFLDHMCESVMGKRSVYELAVSVRDNSPNVSRTSLTPWLETLELLYSLTATHRPERARMLFKNPADMDVLAPDCGEIDDEKGDLRTGHATVRLRDIQTPGVWRLELEKQDEKLWKIVAVKQVR